MQRQTERMQHRRPPNPASSAPPTAPKRHFRALSCPHSVPAFCFLRTRSQPDTRIVSTRRLLSDNLFCIRFLKFNILLDCAPARSKKKITDFIFYALIAIGRVLMIKRKSTLMCTCTRASRAHCRGLRLAGSIGAGAPVLRLCLGRIASVMPERMRAVNEWLLREGRNRVRCIFVSIMDCGESVDTTSVRLQFVPAQLHEQWRILASLE